MIDQAKKELLCELFANLNVGNSNSTDSNSSSISSGNSSSFRMSSSSMSNSSMEIVKQILEVLQSSYFAAVYDIKALLDAQSVDMSASDIEQIEHFLTDKDNVEIKKQLAGHTLNLGTDVDPETKKIFWALADEYFEETPELLMKGLRLEELKKVRAEKEAAMAHLLDTTDLYGNMPYILDDTDLESFDEHMVSMEKAMENILDLTNIESCRDDIAKIKKYLKDNKENFSKELLPELQAMRNKFAENWESVVKDLEARNPKECLGLQEIVKHILNKLDAKYSTIFVEMVDEVLEELIPDYMQGLRHIETCVSNNFSPATLASFFEYMKKPSMLETQEKLVKHELNLAPTEEQGAQVNRIWDSYGFNVGKDIDQRKENFWRLADMVFKQKPTLLMEVDKKKLDANYETAARMCQYRVDMADMFLKNNERNNSSELLQELEEHRIRLAEWAPVAQELEFHSENQRLCKRVVYCRHVLQKKAHTVIYGVIHAVEQFLELNKDNFSKEMLPELQAMRNKFAEDCGSVAKDWEARNPKECLGLQSTVNDILEALEAKCALCMQEIELEEALPDSFLDRLDCQKSVSVAEQFLAHNENNTSKEFLLDLEEHINCLNVWKLIAEQLELRKSKHSSGLCDEVRQAQGKLGARRALCMQNCQQSIGAAKQFLALNKNNTSEELLLELEDHFNGLNGWKLIAEQLKLRGSEDSLKLCDEIKEVQDALKIKRDEVNQLQQKPMSAATRIKGSIRKGPPYSIIFNGDTNLLEANEKYNSVVSNFRKN